MNIEQLRRFLIAAVAAGCGALCFGATGGTVHYELAFERPNTHLLDVTMQLSDLDGKSTEVAMAAWPPGMYSVRNFAANVQGFQAFDASGQPLHWRKTDEETWRVDLNGSHSSTIHYQVFCGTYNDQHVSFTGVSVWMYPVNGKNHPVALRIDTAALPSNWRIATGMKLTADRQFEAPDYDWFADYPIEISNYGERTFEVLGTRYHIIADPDDENEFTKFAGDLKKVVEAAVPIIAPKAPFDEYYFFMHIGQGGGVGGGIEHLNSTAISLSSGWSDHSKTTRGTLEDVYTSKLNLSAHEFFHAWNVKRLRPRELGPFDYTRMVHTPSLWISEGITSYYASLAMLRAGLFTPQQYLNHVAKVFTVLEEKPGRKERSIADTSWDTWFGGAAGGPAFGNSGLGNNLANTNYSYYDGGQTLGFLLDMEIRNATGNRKSLDDWMRLMYERYALPKPGFTPEQAVEAASEVAGKDMSAFFSKYVNGFDPLPYERDLAYGGITVETKARPQAWIGAVLGTSSFPEAGGGRATITNIIPGSPAESDGLDRGDVVIAVNGAVVDRAGFEKALAASKQGEKLALTVSHLGKVRELAVTVGKSPYFDYGLKPMESRSGAQDAIYQSYFGVH